jgi:hypothetical protein
MNLGDILGPDNIVPDLHASNRWETIEELIDNLVATSKIKPEARAAISAVVRKRETSMSTGIGFGIGIPHASTDLIYEVVVSLDAPARCQLRRWTINRSTGDAVSGSARTQSISTRWRTSPNCFTKEFRQALLDAPDAKAFTPSSKLNRHETLIALKGGHRGPATVACFSQIPMLRIS